jgi:voltage-gated potassium channel
MELLGSPGRTLVSIVGFMLAVIVLATVAYMGAGWSFADASYMVLLTVYTVGYGEVHPITTPYLHGVTVALMILGCTGMILLTGALGPVSHHHPASADLRRTARESGNRQA